MSQNHFADILGIQRASMSKAMKGGRRVTIEEAVEMARQLRVPLAEILEKLGYDATGTPLKKDVERADPVRVKREPLQLGRPVPIPASPEAAVLDSVANSHAGEDYVVRFTAPEFTTLCPITGQPDFAHFVIDYCPAKSLLESKSLKLFLASYRNIGAFHEDCTVAIGKRVAAAIKPKYLRIAGFWYPRGGIPIDVFWQTGRLPKSVWLPDMEVEPYRGRGRATIAARAASRVNRRSHMDG